MNISSLRGAIAGALMLAAPSAAKAIDSNLPAAAVVGCFQETAGFATFAHLARDPDGGSATYRLRFDRSLLEEIRFQPRPDGGTHIEVTLSPYYTRSDRAAFAAARGDALERCARPLRIAAAGGMHAR